MDTEIQDIQRRAGIVVEQETPGEKSPEEMLIDHMANEVEFLRRMGNYLGRAMARDRAQVALATLQNRIDGLERAGQEIKAKYGKKEQEEQQAAQELGSGNM